MTRRLYRLMWKTIDLCYGGNLGCEKAPGVLAVIPQIFLLEQEMLDWERALPVDLTLRKSYDLPPEGTDENLYRLERFKVILTLRYNNVRVLLHRPILVKFLDACSQSDLEGQEGALLLQLGHSSLRTCIQASMDIVSVVNSLVHSTGLRRCILGSYWSSLYYSKKDFYLFIPMKYSEPNDVQHLTQPWFSSLLASYAMMLRYPLVLIRFLLSEYESLLTEQRRPCDILIMVTRWLTAVENTWNAWRNCWTFEVISYFYTCIWISQSLIHELVPLFILLTGSLQRPPIRFLLSTPFHQRVNSHWTNQVWTITFRLR